MVERRFPPGPMASRTITSNGAGVNVTGLVRFAFLIFLYLLCSFAIGRSSKQDWSVMQQQFLIIRDTDRLNFRSQGFQFSCTKDRGAVLIINSEARRKDSEQRGAFKKYMLKHYKSWFTFANAEPHSRDISLSELVFVTGACTRINRELAD